LARLKRPWLYISILLFLLLLHGCSSLDYNRKPQPTVKEIKEEELDPLIVPETFIIGSTESPQLFNPLYSLDESSSQLEGMLFDGLVTVDEQLRPKPHLAEKIQQSENGLEYTVTIRRGVKFHDGKELTADDVVFTYSIPLSPDYNGERSSDFEMIESIEKLDKYTVKFRLREKDASFLPVTLSYGILPKHLLKNVQVAKLKEHKFNTSQPVGTGPFRFVKWEKNGFVELAANEHYFLGKPRIKSIKYKIVHNQEVLYEQLKNGEVHYAPEIELTNVKKIKRLRGLDVQSNISHSYVFIGWNEKNELFQDKKVRQALTMAINRKAIVRKILHRQGKEAHIPETPIASIFTDEIQTLKYNRREAKKLLKEAGWEDTDRDGILDREGKDFSFTLKTNKGNVVREKVALLVQKQLKEIGIDVKTEFWEWEDLIKQISPPNWDYDALILEWSLSKFPNHFDIFHSSQREYGLNFVWWENEQADLLLSKSRKIMDESERKQIYKEIFQIIEDEQPYTVLYYPKEFRALPERLNGYIFHPKNYFYKVHEWSFSES